VELFSTSHGKNACDGIGGTVKRATARESLVRTTTGHILTPGDMYKFCCEKLSENIKFLFVNDAEVRKLRESLKSRLQVSKVLVGTRQFHRLVPIRPGFIKAYQLSTDIEGKECCILKATPSEEDPATQPKFTVDQNVCCVFAGVICVGTIRDYTSEFDEYDVQLMDQDHSTTDVYRVSHEAHALPVPGHHVLGVLSPPTFLGPDDGMYIYTGLMRGNYSVQRAACCRMFR